MTVSITSLPVLYAVEVEADGDIIAGGYSEDGGGVKRMAVVKLNGLGAEPEISVEPPTGTELGDGTAGLYTSLQVQALNLGTPLISRSPSTGKFKLTMDWKKSTNLTSFLDFPAQPADVSMNGLGDIEFEFSVPDNAAFFRIEVD